MTDAAVLGVLVGRTGGDGRATGCTHLAMIIAIAVAGVSTCARASNGAGGRGCRARWQALPDGQTGSRRRVAALATVSTRAVAAVAVHAVSAGAISSHTTCIPVRQLVPALIGAGIAGDGSCAVGIALASIEAGRAIGIALI